MSTHKKVAILVNGPDSNGIKRALANIAYTLEGKKEASIKVFNSEEGVPSDLIRQDIVQYQPDILLISVSPRTNVVWGDKDLRAENIIDFVKCGPWKTVVYLHDIYGDTHWDSIKRNLKTLAKASLKFDIAGFKKTLGQLKNTPFEEKFVQGLRSNGVQHFIVSNNIEKRRLLKHKGVKFVSVVPHFVETRFNLLTKDEAKSRLQLSGKKVITMLGFILPRKGYEVAIDTLSLLPQDYTLVLAGSDSSEGQEYLQQLMVRAKELNVDARIVVSGYITDEQMDVYISATDVAFCPFKAVSASGSLATWLAGRKPIVTSKLELFEEYARNFQGMIFTSNNYSPKGFKLAIEDVICLNNAPNTQAESLFVEYSIDNVSERFYQETLRLAQNY